MEHILEKLKRVTKSPADFLSSSNSNANVLRAITKEIYDLGVSVLQHKDDLPIQELVVDDFDDEQVWQELELFNELEFPRLSEDIGRHLISEERLRLRVRVADAAGADDAISDAGSLPGGDLSSRDSCCESGESAAGDDIAAGADDDDDEEEEEDVDRESGIVARAAGRAAERPRRTNTAVDDRFFNVGELEQFLQQQDQRFERETARARRSADQDDSDDEGIDLFTDGVVDGVGSDGDMGARPMYSEFFDPPAGASRPSGSNPVKRKRMEEVAAEDEDVEDDEGGSTDDEPQDPQHMSNLEKRQEKLKRHIERLEEDNLTEKPWQLRGESSAAGRQENALLEQPLDFEQTRRAPVITADVTAELERIVLRRITDAAFDDVQRKVKPVSDPYDFKKRLLLDQEKSKLSLAQVYEQEYTRQKEAVDVRPDEDLAMNVHEDEDNGPKEHEQIRQTMAELFAKLDTLTNFHYVPKQLSAEVKIVTKLPSIAMEENIPIAVSNATLLAPEEIKDKRRSALMASEERSSTDKKRERRKKKHLQSVKAAGRDRKERQLLLQEPHQRAAGRDRQLAEARIDAAAKRPDGRVTKVPKKGGQKAVKSSSAFFSQLQDQVTAEVTGAKVKHKPVKKARSSDVAKMRL